MAVQTEPATGRRQAVSGSGSCAVLSACCCGGPGHRGLRSRTGVRLAAPAGFAAGCSERAATREALRSLAPAAHAAVHPERLETAAAGATALCARDDHPHGPAWKA